MLSSKEISMLIEATGTSVYMTLASTLMAYVIVSRSEFYWLYAHRAA